jgi:hypothetical protein
MKTDRYGSVTEPAAAGERCAGRARGEIEVHSDEMTGERSVLSIEGFRTSASRQELPNEPNLSAAKMLGATKATPRSRSASNRSRPFTNLPRAA